MNTEKHRQGTEAQRDEGAKCKAAPIPRVPIPSGSGVVAAITVLLLMTGHALAQPCGGYEVTAIIQTPVDCGFGFDITTGLGLNDDGAVVGFYWCSGWEHKEAFVWTAEEGFVTLERPQGVSSAIAEDINDAGIICGTAAVSGLGSRGFIYGYEGDQFTILDIPPGGNTSVARGINSAGGIVGFWGDIVNGPFPQAFIWRDGETIDIHPDFGTVKSRALDINADGLVTGWMGDSQLNEARAFVWDNGKVTQLPPLPDGITSEGWSLNCRLDVVGRGRFFDPRLDATVWRAFAFVNGEPFHIDALPGTSHSNALDINNAQTVVGASNSRAFIWQDGLLTDLNDLIKPSFNGDVYLASGINQAGQIAGSATTDLGDLVAVLLTPIEGAAGDLNNDCQVGVKDLLMLLGNWGPCDNCENCPADLNADWVVGVADLLILLGNWG